MSCWIAKWWAPKRMTRLSRVAGHDLNREQEDVLPSDHLLA